MSVKCSNKDFWIFLFFCIYTYSVFAKDDVNLANSALTSSSFPQDREHFLECAVDGDKSLDNFWASGPYPCWIQLDLGCPQKINNINVYMYWGDDRYYQYYIEVSIDGKNWETVVDKRNNIMKSLPDGCSFFFKDIDVRFIRLTVTFNSVNSGVHVVEIETFYKKGFKIEEKHP